MICSQGIVLRVRLYVGVMAAVAACSAPAVDRDVLAGERAEREGRAEDALRAYESALTRCTAPSSLSRARKRVCADTYLARAELLERMERFSEAAAAYERTPEFVTWEPSAAAAGVYRAGRLYLELGQAERGYRLLWMTVTDYPDQDFAGDALEAVVRDGRKRNVGQLYQVLGKLVQPLADTAVVDNILYTMAELAEHDFGDPEAALAHYDKIAIEYPKSTIRDDALWHGARLARSLGDARGAVDRLERLLATREVAFRVGSYYSIWLDNAQLQLGVVLRDDLGELRASLDAFARLPEHYPASVLIDDALWETAVTWERLGERERVCELLDRLANEWPDSKYLFERVPASRARNNC